MTYAPTTLHNLEALWVMEGGASLGIVGDAPHVSGGTSYHLGKNQLIAGAYSATLARDKAGLTNAASAIDLGPLDNRLSNLRLFSVWLVEQIKANPVKYRDVREVIYSDNGTRVLRWDNNLRVLRLGGTGTGQGDNSHLWHTHISFYRDSEFRDKRALFALYFGATEGGGALPGLRFTLDATKDADPTGVLGTARVSVDGASAIRNNGLTLAPLPKGTDLGVVQTGTLDPPLEAQRGRPAVSGNRTSIVAFAMGGEYYVMLRSDVSFTALVDSTPYDDAALAAAKAAGIAEGKASVVIPPDTTPFDQAAVDAAVAEHIEQMQPVIDAAVDQAKIDGARAEWDRQAAEAKIGVTLAPRP